MLKRAFVFRISFAAFFGFLGPAFAANWATYFPGSEFYLFHDKILDAITLIRMGTYLSAFDCSESRSQIFLGNKKEQPYFSQFSLKAWFLMLVFAIFRTGYLLLGWAHTPRRMLPLKAKKEGKISADLFFYRTLTSLSQLFVLPIVKHTEILFEFLQAFSGRLSPFWHFISVDFFFFLH